VAQKAKYKNKSRNVITEKQLDYNIVNYFEKIPIHSIKAELRP
jgi:hypothetical protein